MAIGDKRKREEEEEEPRVRVVDKRRLTEDDSKATEQPASDAKSNATGEDERSAIPASETATVESVQQEPSESSDGESDRDAMLLPVRDLMRIFIAELHMRAWINMGLVANPTNNLVVKDLPEARLAIDVLGAIVEKISPVATPEEREEFNRMLTDLRLNFVQQS